ncbi:MAG: glycoside hydrolase family 2 TIM barrel-domain containing protein [Puniceicoccaceae bacterium]
MTTPLNSKRRFSRAISPNTTYLSDDWSLVSSGRIENGEELHDPGWMSEAAHRTRVPQTVFAALVEDGTYPDPFWSRNLAEYETEPYSVPWIYRKEFDLDPDLPSSQVELILEGFNYRANVWMNGELLADANQMEGAWRIYHLDISDVVEMDDNVLVIEVIPPEKDDLTIGWVDWNVYPPDNNLGLFRPVKIKQSGIVSLQDLCVRTGLDTENFESADIEISGMLTNHSDSPVSGELFATIEKTEVSLCFELDAGESREVVLDTDTHAALRMENPRVWWPHMMGEQPLYILSAKVVVDEETSDQEDVRFGIRTVEDYINEQGHRGYRVNGKEVLIRGGGWRDDLFMRESPERLEAQVRYTRHMNLNTIRLEGFWGSSQELYDLCDEYGILLMVGWSCHWEWKGYCNREEDGYILIKTPEEMEFHSDAFADQAVWLRNHPSLLVWVFGADMIPRPELERSLRRKLELVDPGRPILAGCRQKSADGEEDFTSEVSGPVAVKMVGPYSYVPPVFWFEDREWGGAYGFNTETGPGMQPVVYESLKKFTPAENLWPMDEVWNFHTGKSAFANFDYWLPAFNARYGEGNSAEDFCYRAQMSNYEAMRAQFEAFVINQPEATGIIQWMLNSSMPTHLWQLYDYYLMPTGAFYGTRQAGRSLNVIYDMSSRNIVLVNDRPDTVSNASLQIRAFDSGSNMIHSESVPAVAAAHTIKTVAELPELPSPADSLIFLDLRLEKDGCVLSHSFYWLSTKKDVMDYPATDWHHTPVLEYADLSGITSLDNAQLTGEFVTSIDQNQLKASVRLRNSSDKIAFFLELALQDAKTGETLLPVYWEDNYVSLLPGEERELTASLDSTLVAGRQLQCRVQGINLADGGSSSVSTISGRHGGRPSSLFLTQS